MSSKTVVALILAAGAAFAAGLALAPGSRSSSSGPGAAVSAPSPPAPAPAKPRIDLPSTPSATPAAPSGPPLPADAEKPGPARTETTTGTAKSGSDAQRYHPPSLGSGKDGEGEVIDFHAPFKTREEREAWEAARKKRWEERLARENDAAIALMVQKLGISASQADEVRRILRDQLASRTDLIARLKSGEVGRPQMEEKVRAIRETAHTRLKAVLTPAQYDGYLKLDPREQVLATETNAPK